MTDLVSKVRVKRVEIEAVVLGPCKHCGTGAEWWDSTAGCKHEPTFRRELGVISASSNLNLFARLWSGLKEKLT